MDFGKHHPNGQDPVAHSRGSSRNTQRSNSFRGPRPPPMISFPLSTPMSTAPSTRYTRLKIRLHTFLWMKNHSFGGVPRKIAARPRSLALLAIIALVGLFLTLKDVPSSPLINLRSDDQASEADRLSKPKIDQNGNEIADDPYFTQTEIQRSFEEPDFALLSSKQPHEIGCDVPVRWTWNGTTVEGLGPRAEDGVPEEDTGVLLFLGVFSAAQSAGKTYDEMKRRRDIYRQVYFPYFPPNLVTKKFILGLPTPAPHATHPEAIARARTMRLLAEEAEEHQDIVILDMEDNIDSGKTWKYYEWVAKEYGGEGRVKGRPRFVLKADDDTILVMPNLIQAFKDLDCSKNVYWGTSAGRSKYFGDYFRGLAYGMSWPLVSWIGSAPLPLAHITKIEDARTGQWLRSLDPTVDPIIRYDLGWNMGDWNQLEVGIETVGLHWLKWDEWVSEQQNRILEVWREAGRPYEAGHGVDLATSVESGKRVPEGVIKEHERQKELGWDVAGNIDAS